MSHQKPDIIHLCFNTLQVGKGPFENTLVIHLNEIYLHLQEDHEIFDLVSALENAEGKGTTFYSWLGVTPAATTPEVAKAYRKLSIKLQ